MYIYIYIIFIHIIHVTLYLNINYICKGFSCYIRNDIYIYMKKYFYSIICTINIDIIHKYYIYI